METSLPQTPVTPNPSPNPVNSKKYLILLLIVLVLLAVGGYILVSRKSNNIQKIIPKPLQKIASPSALLNTKPGDSIIKVGQEIIYKQDLETELAAQPANTRYLDTTIKSTLEKLASDSAILQGGQAENLVKLDQTTFNSTNKDYFKRIKLVSDIKKQISDKTDGISGALISIWFNNNFNLGKEGISKRKQIALEKITKLHDAILAKKITIEQAGEVIKNDVTLKEVDLAYQINAFTAFNSSKQTKIFFDDDINYSILRLKPGEVSEVLLGFDKYTDGKKYEAVYVVGQVKEVILTGKVKSFDDWLKVQLSKYEVKYY